MQWSKEMLQFLAFHGICGIVCDAFLSNAPFDRVIR